MTFASPSFQWRARDTAVRNVVERVAADIQIDGQPFNAADFCGTVSG